MRGAFQPIERVTSDKAQRCKGGSPGNKQVRCPAAKTSGFGKYRSRRSLAPRSRRGDKTTMRIILTALSRASAPMNTLGKRWNPLQSHSDFGPKKPVPSPGRGVNAGKWSRSAATAAKIARVEAARRVAADALRYRATALQSSDLGPDRLARRIEVSGGVSAS